MSTARVSSLILRAAAVAHYGAPAAKIAAAIADMENVLGGSTWANCGQQQNAEKVLVALKARPEVSPQVCPNGYTVVGARTTYRVDFIHIGINSIAQVSKA